MPRQYNGRNTKLSDGTISRCFRDGQLLRRDIINTNGTIDSSWYRASATATWRRIIGTHAVIDEKLTFNASNKPFAQLHQDTDQDAAIADKYAGQSCTLDGEEAKVTGHTARFATVASLKSAKAIVFAWPTVDRIMKKEAQFRS